MLNIRYSSKFKKDYKLILKRNYPIKELLNVIDLLRQELPLPEKYKDHQLTGNWIGFKECHIQNDWLLIYRIKNNLLELELTRTGSHSDLFSK